VNYCQVGELILRGYHIHLSVTERSELLSVLDKFSDVFRETPGLCTVVEHTIPIMESFKLKRLRAYKIPENYRVR